MVLQAGPYGASPWAIYPPLVLQTTLCLEDGSVKALQVGLQSFRDFYSNKAPTNYVKAVREPVKKKKLWKIPHLGLSNFSTWTQTSNRQTTTTFGHIELLSASRLCAGTRRRTRWCGRSWTRTAGSICVSAPLQSDNKWQCQCFRHGCEWVPRQANVVFVPCRGHRADAG